MKKIISIVLLISSLLYSKEVCIINFQKQVCKDFTLLQSVILKSKLSKEELELKLDKQLQQIAFLDNANLFLIDSTNPLNDSKELAKLRYIVYAQPNISQTKEKNSQSFQNITQKYKLDKIWKITKGEGVNIAIIDDGFNLEHEDLKGVKLLFSYDVDNKDLGASSKFAVDTHGTQVAGIIFAKHNNIGIDGIAPNANLIAIRQTTNITSDIIISFTIAQKAKAHIINCSWNSPLLLEPVYDIIKSLSKDIAIVFAAGNNQHELEAYSIEASIPEVLTVGATQRYSNFGVLLDFQIKSGTITTCVDGTYGKFGGTSAVAPIIAGLLALKLVQHKNLPIQEVVEILKKEEQWKVRKKKN